MSHRHAGKGENAWPSFREDDHCFPLPPWFRHWGGLCTSAAEDGRLRRLGKTKDFEMKQKMQQDFVRSGKKKQKFQRKSCARPPCAASSSQGYFWCSCLSDALKKDPASLVTKVGPLESKRGSSSLGWALAACRPLSRQRALSCGFTQ